MAGDSGGIRRARAAGAFACLALAAQGGCAPVPGGLAPIVISSGLVVPSEGVREARGRAPWAGGGAGGCFAGQTGGEAWSAEAAESTVMISASERRADGGSVGAFSGTGWVVRESGDASNPRNRILTALHVVRGVIGGGTVEVRSARGVPVGRAYIVARGTPGQARATDGTAVPSGDAIVLGISDFAPGGEAAFAAIRGIPLAPVQPARVLAGAVSVPGGIEPGTSGAPVVSGGKAYGVMVRARPSLSGGDSGPPLRLNAAARGGDPWSGAPAAGRGGREIALPARGVAYAEPITDPGVLAALGAAGAGVVAGAESDRARAFEIPGYPRGQACVLYRGDLGSGGW